MTLIVSFLGPIDLDRFQPNPRKFGKMFIFVHFVHFRNQEGYFRNSYCNGGTHSICSSPNSDFGFLQAKKRREISVSNVCKISDSSSGIVTRAVNVTIKVSTVYVEFGMS